jgi:hypothetical protein
MGRGACAHWQRAARHAPLDRHRRGSLHHGMNVRDYRFEQALA